jgi:hypothetical protein
MRRGIRPLGGRQGDQLMPAVVLHSSQAVGAALLLGCTCGYRWAPPRPAYPAHTTHRSIQMHGLAHVGRTEYPAAALRTGGKPSRG